MRIALALPEIINPKEILMETSTLTSKRSSTLGQPAPHGEAVQTPEQNNLTWHEMKLHRLQRAEHKLQRPCVLWFTGLSGAGKSTVANIVEQKLFEHGSHTYLLDGDNVRHGPN